jgi:hypothetical protein
MPKGVGEQDKPMNTRFRFGAFGIFAVIFICALTQSHAQYGRFTPFDSRASTAYGVNDIRTVTGVSELPQGGTQGFVRRWNKPVAALEPLGERGFTTGYAINNFGIVAGWTQSDPNLYTACLWDSYGRLLGSLPGSRGESTWAYALNDQGWVAGTVQTEDGVTSPVIWERRGNVRFLFAPGVEGKALGINNVNQVVGWYLNRNNERQAFWWSSETGVRDLTGATPSQALAINDAGIIVGSTGSFLGTNAAVWETDITLHTFVRSDIDPLMPGDQTVALAISQDNFIVGNSMRGGSSAAFATHYNANTNTFQPLRAILNEQDGGTLQRAYAVSSNVLMENLQAPVVRCIVGSQSLSDEPQATVTFVTDPHTTSRAIGSINLRLASPIVTEGSTTAHLELSRANTGETIIFLSSDHPEIATVPDWIAIPSGSETVTFPITITAPAMPQAVVITATPPVSYADPPEISKMLFAAPPRSISGIVALQGGAPTAGKTLSIQLRHEATQSDIRLSVSLDADGRYTLPNVPAGAYKMLAATDKWLAKSLAVNVTDSSTTQAHLSLAVGDANGDNAVNITDLLLLIGAYNQNSSQTGYLPSCDFNEDGANNISDLLLLIANYNKTGDASP